MIARPNKGLLTCGLRAQVKNSINELDLSTHLIVEVEALPIG